MPYRYSAAATLVDGTVLPITAGRINLDESWSPYASALITVPYTDDTILDAIDPRKNRRVRITATEDYQVPSGMTRKFDLAIRTRTIDHKDRMIDLELASDEAFLFDKCRLGTTPDKGARAFEASVRGVCEWALAKVPSIIRNLDVNPKAVYTGEASTAAYGTRGSWTRAFTGSPSAPPELPFTSVCRLRPTADRTFASGEGIVSYGTSPFSSSPGTTDVWIAGPTLKAGDTISISRYARMVSPAASFVIAVRFHDGNGNWVGGVTYGSPSGVGGWQRPAWTGVVPAGATRAVACTFTSTATADLTASSTILDVTGLLFEKTDEVRSWREYILEPGNVDADVTAQWDATNLLMNPNATSLTNWSAPSGTTLNYNNAAGWDGVPGFIRAGSNVTTRAYMVPDPSNLPATPGQIYKVSAYVKSVAGTIQVRPGIQYRDADDKVITTWVAGAYFDVGTSWTRVDMQATAPANTAKMAPFVETPAGVLDVDAAMVTEGPVLLNYFDGNSSDPGITRYAYDWQAVTNGSASNRIALPERLPELFSWEPGQSLWEFLRPFLEMTGYRLFCDDQRLWRVIDPAAYQPPTISAINAYASNGNSNTKEATDTVSLDGEEYATGVVVVFRWTDARGIQRSAFDVAGTDQKVITINRDTPPAKGTAASILSSVSQSGNVQDVTGFMQLDTGFPSNVAVVSMPGMVRMVGEARSVSINIGTGEIDFTTRNMEEDPL